MYDWEEDVEDEADDDLRDPEMSGKNVLLFVIDGRAGMLEKSEVGETLFQKSIRAAHATLRSKIFRADKDMIGVLGFATRERIPATLDFAHMAEIVPLDRPCKDSIMTLEKLLGDDGLNVFDSEYGSMEEEEEGTLVLHEVLWHCQAMISRVKGKIATRRIILLTSDPNPHKGDKKRDIQARRKAGDLHDNDIYLEVVPVTLSEQQFDMETFYRDIVRLADDDWTAAGTTDLANLTEVVLKKTYVKRTTSRLKLSLGEGVELGVATYNLLGRASRPSKMRLAADTNEEVKTQRTWIHPRSGAPLLPSDMAKFMTYGDKNIKMTKAEVNFIRSFGEEGNQLKLVGFRPISSLKFGNFIKVSQFLYPCETLVKGSRSLFSSLLLRCYERGVAAVCKLKQRTTSGPNFVALVPQKEELEEGEQVKPPGFNMIFLPFLDDFRQLPATRLNKDNPREAVDAAKAVINKLKLKKFIPVENGAVQSTYRMIEAHALHRATVEETVDETLPDLERMERKLGEKGRQFMEEVYDEHYNPEAPPKKAAKTGSGGGGRKPAAGSAANVADDIDMAGTVAAGQVAKLTVEVLKTWLKGQGVPVSNLKKAQLVEAVIARF